MKTNMPNGVTDKELKEMQSVDIMTVDINSLADINDVVLNPDLPKEKRAKEFIRQIKNPFCYRDGDVIVKISFSDNNVTLEERLEDYFPCIDLQKVTCEFLIDFFESLHYIKVEL